MTFLTKGLWLSLWQTKNASLLGSCLANLKSYTTGRHKFIDSVKYYQQSLSKLATSTSADEKGKIKNLFPDYLGYVHPYYSLFFMNELSQKDKEFVLEYLASGKGWFPYEIVTAFNSLYAVREDGDFWPIESFYSRLKDQGSLKKSGKDVEKPSKF